MIFEQFFSYTPAASPRRLSSSHSLIKERQKKVAGILASCFLTLNNIIYRNLKKKETIENSSKTLTFFILVAGEVQKHGTISNTNALIL